MEAAQSPRAQARRRAALDTACSAWLAVPRGGVHGCALRATGAEEAGAWASARVCGRTDNFARQVGEENVAVHRVIEHLARERATPQRSATRHTAGAGRGP